MYCTPAKTVAAKKKHRCTNCGESIEAGTTYARWMSVDDGTACTNKMHPECLQSLRYDNDGIFWEYTLYGGERPNERN
jgi:hypothetical protein